MLDDPLKQEHRHRCLMWFMRIVDRAVDKMYSVAEALIRGFATILNDYIPGQTSY
jgi:hypothetical protein